MATTQNEHNGDGSDRRFSFTFPYIKEDDVRISLRLSEANVSLLPTTAYTFPTATEIQFNAVAETDFQEATGAPKSGVTIRIFRDTDLETQRVTFFPGSSIRAQDLNDSVLQTLYANQERENRAIDKTGDSMTGNLNLESDLVFEGATADDFETTLTVVDPTADRTITFPDTTGTVVTTGDTGTVTSAMIADLSIVDADVAAAANIDGSKLLNDSVQATKLEHIDSTEQNADPVGADTSVFTSAAAIKRFRGYVQNDAPATAGVGTGAIWVDIADDKKLYTFDGTNWVAVTSGGTFITFDKVIYVDASSGSDSSDGKKISNPKRTIRSALASINADANGDGFLISVAPGIYAEHLPLDIQKNDVAVIGQSLRTCIIHPLVGGRLATETVSAREYRIEIAGTTDFTTIGAADNNVGTVFTATGAGTGTGTVVDTAVEAAYVVGTPDAQELTSMFRVNSGSYFQNLTLMGMKANGVRGAAGSLYTDATHGLPPEQGWNFSFFPNAIIRKSPYIQNCTNFSDSEINNVTFTPHTPGEGAAGDNDSGPTGGGILVNGSVPANASPLRSIVCDSYTHTALDGPGIFVTNNGYCQATSSYAFFNHAHITCLNGGQANLAASTSDFGRFSLIADGKSSTNIFSADVAADADSGATSFVIDAQTPDASWHGDATRPASNMLVTVNSVTYPILSSTNEFTAGSFIVGRAYTILTVGTTDFTLIGAADNLVGTVFTATGVGAGDGTATDNTGWSVTISRPNSNNRSQNDGLNGAITTANNAQFFLRSMIASSGHTMEYVGSGTDYRALPENGGVPIEKNQKIEKNSGKIWCAVTDHNGKFTIGGNQQAGVAGDPFFEVDQQTGFVTIPEGSISFNLLSDETPQLGGDLDVNDSKITSANNGNVHIGPHGTGSIRVDAPIITNANNNLILKPHGSGVVEITADITKTSTGENSNLNLNAEGTGSVVIRGNTTEAGNPPVAGVNRGKLVLNCEQNSHGVTIQAPTHANISNDDGSYTLTLPSGHPDTAGKALVSNLTGDLSWAFAGGAKGDGNNQVFFENDQTVSGDYTVTAGKNAGSFGPITINAGVEVEIPATSRWTIV